MVTHVKKSVSELIELYVIKSSKKFGENGTFSTECWQWIGALDSDGYGQLTFRHKHHRAHRFLFKFWTGDLPANRQLDHLCRNRSCVRPDHLEPVSLRENLRRGINFNKARCVNGHEFTARNTYVTKLGHRQCRICKRDNQQRYVGLRNATP